MVDILVLEVRKDIYDLVAGHPGIHLRELARLSGLSMSTLRYEVDVLVKHEYLVRRDEGGFSRFYIHGKIGAGDKRLLAVLRRELPRGIVVYLLANDGGTPGEIAKAFEIGPSKLSYHLSTLNDAGVIGFEQIGRQRRYSVVDEDTVVSVLIRYRPSFKDKLLDRYLG